MLTSSFNKSQERPSLSRPTPHTPYNFHQATDRKRKAGSEQQVSQDGMICKIRFLVDHVFLFIIIILYFFFVCNHDIKIQKKKKNTENTLKGKKDKKKKKKNK